MVKKISTLLLIVTFIVTMLFWLNACIQVVDMKIAGKIFFGVYATYYCFNAISLFYESHIYENEEDKMVLDFLPSGAFKEPVDFVRYKFTNNTLIERVELWQLKHNTVRRHHMHYRAAISLFLGLLLWLGFFL